MSTDERQVKLDDLEKKQNELSQLRIEIKDKYGEEPESGLLLSNLNNAGDQVLKLRQRFAVGDPAPQLPAEEEK